MPNRSRKPRLPDPNQVARAIVEGVTGERLAESPAAATDERDPAAVALGRRGGLKGGKARAAALTPEQRSQSAAKAAAARWAKRNRPAE